MSGVPRQGGPPEPAAGEIPVPVRISREDARFAVRAVVLHVPRGGASGPLCRSDCLTYPCRLARWGRRVLASRGLSEGAVAALVERGDPDADPDADPDLAGGQEAGR